MIELALAWLTGAGVLALIFLGIMILGYVSRMATPVDTRDDPFKYPSWELNREDVGASLVAGFITAVAIFVPLCLGSLILV